MGIDGAGPENFRFLRIYEAEDGGFEADCAGAAIDDVFDFMAECFFDVLSFGRA